MYTMVNVARLPKVSAAKILQRNTKYHTILKLNIGVTSLQLALQLPHALHYLSSSCTGKLGYVIFSFPPSPMKLSIACKTKGGGGVNTYTYTVGRVKYSIHNSHAYTEHLTQIET